ncbi:MAG: hypothetical protein KF708_17070 [Pirellulales bacterium]|nr:hypothetical protein [Pirellulales bacterium]
MFSLHEATRRGLFRLAFVLLAVIPTAGLASWTAVRHMPGYVDAFEATIAERTGLDTSLKAIDHLRPGEMRLVQLELRDPETGLLIARAERVTLTQTADLIALDLEDAKLESGGLANAWHALDRRLRRQGGNLPHGQLRITASSLTTHAAEQPLVLHAVEAHLDSSAVETKLELTFSTNDANDADKVTLHVDRDRRTNPPTFRFELIAEEDPLPCALAEPLWSAAPWFGPQAEFRGRVKSVEGTNADWITTIRGRFSKVDVRNAIEAHFPHSMRGSAEVLLEEASLENERLVAARGTITAGPGHIALSLIDSSWRSLRLLFGGQTTEEGKIIGLPELIHYDSLACHFDVDGTGIHLTPLPNAPLLKDKEGRDAGYPLLTDGPLPLLAIPIQYQRQPVTVLVKALVPPTADKLPADDRAAWLLRALPAPQQARRPPG